MYLHKYFFALLFFTIQITIILYATSFYSQTIKSAQQLKDDEFGFYSCATPKLRFSFEIHGNYTIFHNYIRASRSFQCDKSITLTTHAEYRYIKHLPLLAERWQGPISVAVYAPGEDFLNAIALIAHVRHCSNRLVRELVTFHLFFDHTHIPNEIREPIINSYIDIYNCSNGIPFENQTKSYRETNNLLYPINLARNIARKNVQTHFVFPLDVELLPTTGFIPKFLNFVHRQYENYFQDNKLRVFVLPIFEIRGNTTLPSNKMELQQLYKQRRVIFFHSLVCRMCHLTIKGVQWLNTMQVNDEIDVFTAGKRTYKYRWWEPFYVGTNREPWFDERQSWESQLNKISQATALCLLDYEFVILDNAFLLHLPGIKLKKGKRPGHVIPMLYTNIKKQYMRLIGKQAHCSI